MSPCAENILTRRVRAASFSFGVHPRVDIIISMMKSAISVLLAAAILTGAAEAKTTASYVWPELGVETQINFPNQGAIRNFEADGNEGIWLEDRQRRWYYAELLGGCQELNFVQAIGFDTRGSATFDKFSTILVAGERCAVASLVTANKPLPRKERLKLRKAAVEASKDVVAPSN